MNVVHGPMSIPVDLEVSRFREFHSKDLVEVWGYVGDYEVCIYLSKTDKWVQALRKAIKRAARREPRSPES
jgi:hypothetical protein